MKPKLIAFIAKERTTSRMLDQLSDSNVRHIQSTDYIALCHHPLCKAVSHIIVDLDLITDIGIHEISNKATDVPILGISSELSAKRITELFKIGISAFVGKEDYNTHFGRCFDQWSKYGAFISAVFANELAGYYSKYKYEKLAALPKKRARIARELIDGSTYRDVAERNYISLETVRDHVKKIYKELNVHSRSELRQY